MFIPRGAGHAQTVGAAAHMLDGLQGLHIDMLALYWLFLFLLQA